MKRSSVLLAIVLAVTLLALLTITVLAWNTPTVSSICAPDATHFAFKVTLAAESDYNMEWSFDSGFAGATSITLNVGENIIPVPRGAHSGGDWWYIRFVSDNSFGGSTQSDETLCNPPVPTDTPAATVTNTATYTPTATATAISMATPTNTPSPTNTLPPGVTPTNTIVAPTPTNTSVPPQESTPIHPPVTGASSGPPVSPILPIIGILAIILTILGLALKPRKAIGPIK